MNGQILQETDPNGLTTLYAYDTFQRKIKEIKPYDTDTLPTTLIQYSIDGIPPERFTTKKRQTAGSSSSLDTYQFVDGFGNLIQSKTEYETSTYLITSDTFYDKMGRVEKQSRPYLTDYSTGYSTPVTSTPSTSYDYDTLGRSILITNLDDTQISRVFDHWKVTETDENEHEKTYTFDASQRLKQVVENNDGTLYTTNYLYSPLGELTRITDHSGNITTIEYDTLGRKYRMVDPDMGIWLYGYDGVGNLTSQTDARGITTNITYDPLNRKELIDYPNSTDIQFTYDKDQDCSGTGTIGTLCKVADAAGTVNYLYDQRLRKVQETRTMDNNTWTTKWGYDSMDRITSMTYPDGQNVTFVYNIQGKLNSITGIINNIDYNAAGQMTKKDYANGKSTTYNHDNRNLRLTELKTTGLQDFTYGYDPVGNIKSIADAISGKTENYTYDDLDRLKTAGDNVYSIQYQYNAIGNMQSMTKDSKTTSFTYGPTNNKPHAVTGMTVPLPVVGSFVINGGDPFTTTNLVRLDNVSLGDPTLYMASEDINFAGAMWQTYSASPTFLLSAGFGQKTVYFKVMNADGESNVKSDSIELRLNPEDGSRDDDGDGLSNYLENILGTNPQSSDTDGDGISDYEEIYGSNTNPTNPDSDGDGVNDSEDRDPETAFSRSFSENYGLRHTLNEGGEFREEDSYKVYDSLGNAVGKDTIQLASFPSLSVNPLIGDFQTVQVGNSRTIIFVLSNTGQGNLDIGTIQIDGAVQNQFVKQSDDCSGQAIAPSANCSVQVDFSPDSIGLKNAQIAISSNDRIDAVKEVQMAGVGTETELCTYSINPESQIFTYSGGAGSITVNASLNGCQWTAVSNDNWVTITSGSSGSGTGTVNFSVGQNLSTITREGTITVAGSNFRITQQGINTCIDNDSDGYGNPGYISCPNGTETDCDDSNPVIHPSAAEVCDNGVDDNCNNEMDEGCDDSDNDGIIDSEDNCPMVSNPEQTDNDTDGRGNACDNCPDDPLKTEPGICGCGVTDTDLDESGTHVSGTLTVDTYWQKLCGPYLLEEDLYISQGVTLTIEEGSKVMFEESRFMQVEGTLIARATAGNEIVFTSYIPGDQTGTWNLFFTDTSSDAAYDLDGNYTGGSIFENCVIENGFGLILEGAHPFINYCNIQNNVAGILGYQISGKLKIINNIIRDNEGTGIVIMGNNIMTTIENNSIAGNYGGIEISGEGFIGSAQINNNLVVDNQKGWISVTGLNTALITGNIIADNMSTGGINTSAESVSISQNIVTTNATDNQKGGINIEGFGNSTTLITNNTVINTVAYKGGCISGMSGSGATQGIFTILHNTLIDNSNTDKANGESMILFDGLTNVIPIQATLSNNNLISQSAYVLYNWNPSVITATDNYWGTTVEADIQEKIYDSSDLGSLGAVNYSPYLSAHDVTAPISPPTGLSTVINGNDIIVSWNANPESDLAGYIVYWDTYAEYPYTNSVNAGNVISYTIQGIDLSKKYYVAVTAYDTSYDPAIDNMDTVVNENQTSGFESWYTIVDSDKDGIQDLADNCQQVFNPDQTDTDNDNIGDVCDPDIDNDTIPNDSDNCPYIDNSDQTNADSDSYGDICDPCPLNPLNMQTFYEDFDADGFGNPVISQEACEQPQGYVLDSTDCADNDNAIYPGVPDICDGFDNDCSESTPDGSAEAWFGNPTTCGTGVCGSTGQLTCLNGVQTDTCIPGLPTGDDSNCDGIDDNCDGTPDNNYIPSFINCGVGICSSTGQIICLNGIEQNTCVPKSPSESTERSCGDLLDNDCDGMVDCDDTNCTAICGGLIGMSVYFDKKEQWLIMAYTEPSAGSYSVFLMVVDTNGKLVTVESIAGLTVNPYKVAGDAINQVVGLAFDSGSRTAKISYIDASGMKLIQVPNISPPCAPDMEVTPASLLFNTVCTGSTTTKIITICNNGNYPLNILGIAPPVAPYSISRNTCGSAVAPQACCEIDVTLSPSSANTYNSSVGINTDDGSATVGLLSTVEGCGPKMQVTPNPLDFGSVKVYTTATKTVTVSNTGGANLTITSVGYPSNYFYKMQDACAYKTLVPGASCSISIMFYSTKVATFTSSFVINSNDVGVTVNLTGKGY